MPWRERTLTRLLASLLLAGVGAALLAAPARPLPAVRIGVFYYGGWSPGIRWATYPQPWAPIERFPDRMPLAGPYTDSEPATLRRQLDEMRRGRLAFVVFDAYIAPGGTLRATQAVDAYQKVARADDPRFALIWANHDPFLKTPADWDRIVGQWIARYLSDPRYFRYKGRPALFVFRSDALEAQARAMGRSTADLFATAQRAARAAGLPGIAFVGGSGPRPPAQTRAARDAGYAAVTIYGMGPGSNAPPRAIPGYAGRDARDRSYWAGWLADPNLPVILPLDAGWDRTPWGGTKPPVEDGSMSTPAQFAAHVRAGLAALAGKLADERVAVVCCWNEYGEGSVIEPTRRYGDGHLAALRAAQGR